MRASSCSGATIPTVSRTRREVSRLYKTDLSSLQMQHRREVSRLYKYDLASLQMQHRREVSRLYKCANLLHELINQLDRFIEPTGKQQKRMRRILMGIHIRKQAKLAHLSTKIFPSRMHTRNT